MMVPESRTELADHLQRWCPAPCSWEEIIQGLRSLLPTGPVVTEGGSSLMPYSLSPLRGFKIQQSLLLDGTGSCKRLWMSHAVLHGTAVLWSRATMLATVGFDT